MKFMIRLVLCLSILQTPYVRAEWDETQSPRSPTQAIDQLRELVQNASPQEQQQLALLAMQAFQNVPQKPLPGMELDALFINQANHLAEQILVDFKKNQSQLENNIHIKALQEILEKATPEDQEFLIELAKSFEHIEIPLPGMELDVLRSIQSAPTAFLIVNYFNKMKDAKSIDDRNAQLATSLESTTQNIYPNSPLATEAATHQMYPKMVHQLIVQFLLKPELSENPKYLETVPGKQRYEKLRSLFLAKQSTTPGLPAERFQVYTRHWPQVPLFQNSNGPPPMDRVLPHLREYMSILAEEAAISLQLAYKAREKQQWNKVKDYTNRAQTFVSAAYLAAGNHRSDPVALREKQVKLSGLYATESLLTLLAMGAFNSSAVSPEVLLLAVATTVASFSFSFLSIVKRDTFKNHLGLYNSHDMYPDRTEKDVQDFSRKRLRSWLPKFFRQRLDSELSQKTISMFWYSLKEAIRTPPAFDINYNDSSYSEIFHLKKTKLQIPGPSKSDSTMEAQNEAVDWFYEISEKLATEPTSPRQQQKIRCEIFFGNKSKNYTF